MIQDAKFTRNEKAEEHRKERGVEPQGFRWEADGIGSVVVTPHVTDFDFTVEGYNFKAHLTKEVGLFPFVKLHLTSSQHRCARLTWPLSIE